MTSAAVTVQPAQRLVNFVGTLYGDQDVPLSSQIEGQLETVNADLGDQVTAGQALASIDDEQWLARLREAEANLAKARADEARSRQLAAEKVVSPQEYETVKTRASVAEAQRDLLMVTIRHATVASPLTGAIAKRFVSAGEYVRPGTPLFTLVAEDPLELRGDVPERFAHELRVGQTVQVRVDAQAAKASASCLRYSSRRSPTPCSMTSAMRASGCACARLCTPSGRACAPPRMAGYGRDRPRRPC